MSEALRFELLGPQRAWYADRPIDLGPAKQRAVLAVLLLAAGRPVPTGQIVEAVWPEEAPVNGPNVVQKHVAGLRRVLEPDRSPRTPARVLTLTDAGYLLRVAPETVDAVRFERGVQRARQAQSAGRAADALDEVTAALELWQGEPFTGFTGPWFDAARHRLVELRAVALETRTELELAAGRHGEVVGRLVELVAEFPVRERLRLQLMLALYRSGRQAEALAAYRDFAASLREDHGIEPGEALQTLHRRILRSDPTLLPTVAEPLDPPAVPLPPAGGPAATTAASAQPSASIAPPVQPAAPPGTDTAPTAGPGVTAASPPAQPAPPRPDAPATPLPGPATAPAGPVGPPVPPAHVPTPAAPHEHVPTPAAPHEHVPVPPVSVGHVESPPVPTGHVPTPSVPVGPPTAPAGVTPAPGGPGSVDPSSGPVSAVPVAYPQALFVSAGRPAETPPDRRSPGWVRATATLVGAAVTVLSVGILTWAVILAYALWRRSWRLALGALPYFLLVVSVFGLAVSSPVEEEPSDPMVIYFLFGLCVCWMLGTLHVVLLNPALWAALRGLFWTGPQRADEQRRLRREQARYLLHHYPSARRDLRIGRPDLLREFDDGGLVDVNAVPDTVFATLPGLTAEQRRQVAVDRWLRGPYGSLEELVVRCQLPPAATGALREVLLFLPPEPPPGPPVTPTSPGRNAG
ncbi:DNA-binding transcriptional activator of the SARP family [Micromonospora sediminicola]|uniref:DNA-binding transcriptional activator of the SARP family n=1 Tax=Micromonospora sediminicola TaxID=946078 RepID=A0A1A9B5K2_9ACTN|nr:BTAD domain-containing putative transcriptional regulator [Micromonospora sediminicola]SBT64187.1 DNA-binding transcriptional activator of the SARP family [Micromonospora sediminicola]